MDFIYRADKLFRSIHNLCEEIAEYERKCANEEMLKSALLQCTCRVKEVGIYSPDDWWFHVSDQRNIGICTCRVLSFNPRKIKIDTNYAIRCKHDSDLYHVNKCKLQTYVWPKDIVFEHYTPNSSKIEDKFINEIQPLYEEVRPGFHDNLTKRDAIDTFYLLLLNMVDRALPDKYDFIKLVMGSTDLLPPLAEICNLKIKMRAFGYKDAAIDKLCEYF